MAVKEGLDLLDLQGSAMALEGCSPLCVVVFAAAKYVDLHAPANEW